MPNLTLLCLSRLRCVSNGVFVFVFLCWWLGPGLAVTVQQSAPSQDECSALGCTRHQAPVQRIPQMSPSSLVAGVPTCPPAAPASCWPGPWAPPPAPGSSPVSRLLAPGCRVTIVTIHCNYPPSCTIIHCSHVTHTPLPVCTVSVPTL